MWQRRRLDHRYLISTAAAAALAAVIGMSSGGSAPASVERGQYLVHSVAMCVQCHSPRDESGELIGTRLLSGAPMPVKSPFRGKEWASRAPNLRGLTGFSDEAVTRLLTEGVAHTGQPPDGPMPPFRLNREDAAAVIAYLKSLS